MADATPTTPASRRGFLRVVASAPAALTAPIAADALSEGMIAALALYHRLKIDNDEAWTAMEASTAHRGTPEGSRLWNAVDDTNHARREGAFQLARTPAATMADVRAKVAEVARMFGWDATELRSEMVNETSADSENLAGSVLADLIQLWSIGAPS